jgi:hypothetical protein
MVEALAADTVADLAAAVSVVAVTAAALVAATGRLSVVLLQEPLLGLEALGEVLEVGEFHIVRTVSSISTSGFSFL